MAEFPKQFFGSDGQSAIFASLADVPAGWQDHPGYYDTQRGIWVSQDTPNPGDIRTDEQRAADIAAEKVRHPVLPERGSGLNVDFDGNGSPLGRPLDAGAAAAERARLVAGKPMSDEEKLAFERNPDGRAARGPVGTNVPEAGRPFGQHLGAPFAQAPNQANPFNSVAEKPALVGLSKARLLAVAEAEGVAIKDGATNKEISRAIEAKRK